MKIWFIANIVFWGLGGLWVQQTGFHSWCSVMTVLTRWQVCDIMFASLLFNDEDQVSNSA